MFGLPSFRYRELLEVPVDVARLSRRDMPSQLMKSDISWLLPAAYSVHAEWDALFGPV